MKGMYSGIFLLFVGVALVVIGIALGLGGVGGCGAVFGSGSKQASTLGDILCEDQISERALGVWWLILGGIGLALIGVLQTVSASRRSSTAPSKRTNARPPATSPDIAEQLAKLADMHTSGVLTDSEFDEAKNRVLSGEKRKRGHS